MNKYVPFNYFSFQKEDDYDGERLGLGGGEFTEKDLELRDDTYRVVDEIVDKMKYCGSVLEQDEIHMSYYDEDGNYHAKEEGEKETPILLIAFPGVFVPKDALDNYLTVIKRGGILHNDIHGGSLQLLLASAYQGKYPVKFVISPKTFIADHYDEMEKDWGVSAEENSIEGIVDFNLLRMLLRERGIDMSITANNSNDFKDELYDKIQEFSAICGMDNERFYNMLREWEESVTVPNIEYPDESTFLGVLQRTRMQSCMNVSIPFSKYLKEYKEKGTAKQ